MAGQETNTGRPGSNLATGAADGSRSSAGLMRHHFLYLGDWRPTGVRKAWDKCSMTLDSSARYLGRLAKGDAALVECVGWFDDDGSARVVVGDFDDGRRVIVRLNLRNTKITFSRCDERFAFGGA